MFVEEPLPATSPLWDMENVIITAHYAGATPKYEQRAMAIFLDNIQRYRAGTPVPVTVEPASRSFADFRTDIELMATELVG